MRSQDAPETKSASSSLARSLVVNQTIGVLALAGLVAALHGSTRVRELIARTAIGSHIAEWLTAKMLAADLGDVLWVLVMVGLMIAWTALFQKVMSRGEPVSRTEWTAGGKGGTLLALYLVATASIVEETVFRGVVLPATAYFLGPLGGLLASALLFGLVHFEKGRPGQVVVAGYGMILGGSLLLGCSLPACIVAHAGGNALAFLLPQVRQAEGRRS